MQKAQNNENKENTMKRVYTYQDLIKFSGTEIYSAFGEMRTSDKPSAPHFSFGTSTRDAEVKKFTTKEMAVIDCFGKSTSQGLKYDPTDKYQYEEAPKWKFGSAVRNTIDSKIKYQHYDRVDLDTDIVQADKVRRNNNGNTRIGVESRFPPEEKLFKVTPGPQYNPKLPLEIPNSPQFSLYARRSVKGFDPLIQLNSTPPIVGPGSYHPQNAAKTSEVANTPMWSVPKSPKLQIIKKKWEVNQTYDTTSSIGDQFNSKKKTLPSYSTGKSIRDNPRGLFKQHQQNRPIAVRINHPRY